MGDRRQRVPKQRIAEFKARIDGPQDPPPGIVGPRLRPARPQDRGELPGNPVT
jgi:hypothetical protein